MSIVDKLADENASLRAEVKALRRAVRTMAKAIDVVSGNCCDLHHPRRYQHAPDEPCPCEALVRKAAEVRP